MGNVVPHEFIIGYVGIDKDIKEQMKLNSAICIQSGFNVPIHNVYIDFTLLYNLMVFLDQVEYGDPSEEVKAYSPLTKVLSSVSDNSSGNSSGNSSDNSSDKSSGKSSDGKSDRKSDGKSDKSGKLHS